MLQDIAILCGAQVISEELGIKLENVGVDMLGKARKIIVTKDETTIVEGAGSADDVKGRINQIKGELERTDSDYDREKLQERLAKLAGGVAVIKVGAATEVELKEKKHRIEDAVQSTKAAVEEGIVPGGGVALIRVTPDVQKAADALTDPDEKTGALIVRKALEEPLKQIVDQRRLRRRRDHREGARPEGERGLQRRDRRVRRHVQVRCPGPGEGDAFRAAERSVDRGAVPDDGSRHRREAREGRRRDAGRYARRRHGRHGLLGPTGSSTAAAEAAAGAKDHHEAGPSGGPLLFRRPVPGPGPAAGIAVYTDPWTENRNYRGFASHESRTSWTRSAIGPRKRFA